MHKISQKLCMKKIFKKSMFTNVLGKSFSVSRIFPMQRNLNIVIECCTIYAFPD